MTDKTRGLDFQLRSLPASISIIHKSHVCVVEGENQSCSSTWQHSYVGTPG